MPRFALLVTLLFSALLTVGGGQTSTAHALPRFVSGAVPVYPPVAWTAHVSGTVLLEITVADGSVAAVRVLKSPSQTLAAPTVENVRTWRFAPHAAAILRVSYTYRITGAATDAPANPRIELDLPGAVTVTVRPFKPTVSY